MMSIPKLGDALKIAREAETIARAPASKASHTAPDTLERTSRSQLREAARTPLQRPVTILQSVRIATSKERVMAAWRLVHDEYVRAKILDAPRPHGIHAPRTLLEAAPFVLTRTENGHISSTLTVTPGQRLPADNVPAFHGILAGLRARGETLVELGMFARDSRAPRSGLGGASLRSDNASGANSMKALFVAALAAAKHEGATRAVITVHPNHVRYYTKLLGFHVIGDEAAHPSVDGARAVLLATDLTTFRAATGGAEIERQATAMLREMPSAQRRHAIMQRVAEALR